MVTIPNIKRPGRMRLSNIVGLGLPLILLLLSVFNALPVGSGCALEAAHHQPGDYCYRMRVNITNSNTAALTDYPVRLTIPASDFEVQGFIRPNGWDIRSYSNALSEIESQVQDLTSNTSGWWISTTVNGGSSATPASWSGWVYMGNPSVDRDQGVFLAGSDLMTVQDDVALEWADDFDLVVKASVAPTFASQTNAGWIDKYSSGTNSGYYLGYDNGNVVGKVGDGTTTDTVSAAWDGVEANFRLRFDAGGASKLILAKYDTNTSTWVDQATGGTIASVLHNANDFEMGENFTGVLRNVQAYENVGQPTYSRLLFYGFDPLNMVETSAVDPNYSGTIANLMSANHPATYNWNRSQSGIAPTLGPVMPIQANPAESIPERFKTVFNNPSDVNMFQTGTTNTNMPFFSVFSTAQADMGITGNAFWVLLFGGLFGVLGIAVLMTTRRPEIAAIVPGAGLIIGAFNGLIAPWITLLYAIAAISVWLIGKWGTE